MWGDTVKNYNDRLRELREDNDLKQKDIAKVLGINQQVYSRYELGIRSLPIEHLIKLCKFYNVSSDLILGIETDNTESDVDNNENHPKLPQIFMTCTDDELDLITSIINACREFINKKC